MMNRAIAIAICSLIGLPAHAQDGCAPHEIMERVLADNYGETVQMAGVGMQGTAILQIYANTDTGSWTSVVTDTEGTACVTGAGRNFEATPTPPAVGERS